MVLLWDCPFRKLDSPKFFNIMGDMDYLDTEVKVIQMSSRCGGLGTREYSTRVSLSRVLTQSGRTGEEFLKLV